MIKVLIPLCYTFNSRFKTKFDKLSWLIIYFVPIFTLIFANTNLPFYWLITTFLIALMVVYSVYELGYIENDVITIKKEKRPTIRIKKNEIKFIDENYKKIVLLKLVIIIVLLFFLAILNSYFNLNLKIILFIWLLILMRCVFYFHNSIRNTFNILTFFLLSFLKYITPIILYSGEEKCIILLSFVLLMFNIPRTLEHATKIKYQVAFLQKIIGNHDVFRVKYYLTILVSLVFLRLFVDYNMTYILIISWFFMYRLFVIFILKYKYFERAK